MLDKTAFLLDACNDVRKMAGDLIELLDKVDSESALWCVLHKQIRKATGTIALECDWSTTRHALWSRRPLLRQSNSFASDDIVAQLLWSHAGGVVARLARANTTHWYTFHTNTTQFHTYSSVP